MSKILQIMQPPIKEYQQIALPMSVAMLNTTAENWLYSNFIQVSCVKRSHYLSKGNRDNALHYGVYNPEITAQDTADHLCLQGNDRLYLFKKVNNITEAIDEGWYVYTDADMFYIDNSDSFEQFHYQHDLLIYGYDDKNFYIYMYDANKLTSHKVCYDHFMDGYFSDYTKEKEPFYRNRAILFRPNDAKAEVNLTKIKFYMHDYLNGVETFAREYPNIFNPDSLTVHGIATYAEFIDLINQNLNDEEKYLRRMDFFSLYEHKKVMFDRVKYLKDNNVLSLSSKLEAEFKEIAQISNKIMLLALKHNSVKTNEQKNTILNSMNTMITDLRNKEEFAWNRYIEENKESLA